MNKVENLVKKLTKYSEDYYSGKQTISDDEYDFLIEQLIELDPENPYLCKVGSPNMTEITKEEKVKHIVPMLSMKKVKHPQEAYKWMVAVYLQNEADINKLSFEKWVIQPKIDGVSCTIRYDENGRFKYMATRGDGSEGIVVSYGSDILKNNGLPFILYDVNSKYYDILNGNEIELRGEFYISKNTKNIEGPLRNALAGLIKRKDYTEELVNVKICLYAMVNITKQYFISYGDLFPETISKNNTIIPYSIKINCNDISATYEQYLKSVRNNLPFETDGLVIYYPNKEKYEIIDSKSLDKAHHHYTMALKPPSQAKKTKVIRINWNLSKYGQLIPIVEFEPIEIGNTILTNASMSNWDYLMNKNIKINSIISVARINDILPKVMDYFPEESRNEIPIEIPKSCPSCGSLVEKIDKNYICTNPYCKGILAARIEYISKQIKIKGLAINSIKKIIAESKDPEVNDLTSFFISILNTKNPEKIIGEKNGEKIRQSMLESIKNELNTKTLIAYCANIPSLGMKELEKEEIYDPIEFFERVKSNPNTAVKRSIVHWYENKNLVNEFMTFYVFIIKFLKGENL